MRRQFTLRTALYTRTLQLQQTQRSAVQPALLPTPPARTTLRLYSSSKAVTKDAFRRLALHILQRNVLPRNWATH